MQLLSTILYQLFFFALAEGAKIVLVKYKTQHQLEAWSMYTGYFGTILGIGCVATVPGIELGGFHPVVEIWPLGSQICVAIIALSFLLQIHIHHLNKGKRK